MDTSNPKFKLIIGLGNPDPKYQNTYHNVGHLFINYLTKSSQLKAKSLKTDVYMNESGTFVKKIIKKSGIKPEEMLVVQDDSDIDIGNYKFSFGRGSAGHKGIESIIRVLRTKNFWRLRMGIRPKPKADLPAEAHRAKAGEFVLKKISAGNKEILKTVFQKAGKGF